MSCVPSNTSISTVALGYAVLIDLTTGVANKTSPMRRVHITSAFLRPAFNWNLSLKTYGFKY